MAEVIVKYFACSSAAPARQDCPAVFKVHLMSTHTTGRERGRPHTGAHELSD